MIEHSVGDDVVAVFSRELFVYVIVVFKDKYFLVVFVYSCKEFLDIFQFVSDEHVVLAIVAVIFTFD